MERGSDGERDRQTAKEREREREAAAAWGREKKKKKSTHPNWPSGYESLKNEDAVIILIRYKVFFNTYSVCM